MALINEEEANRIVALVARKLETLKGKFAHFDNFDAAKDVFGLGVYYHNNVQWIADPHYEEEAKAEEEERKRGSVFWRLPIPGKLPHYPEKDGISIDVMLTNREPVTQRVLFPYTHIGNYAVEVFVRGADTKEISEIRQAVYGIIDEVKATTNPR